MKKSLTLALALVALTVVAGVGLAQQRGGSQVGPGSKAPAGPVSTAPATSMVLQSTPAEINWPARPGTKPGDLAESLRGQQLTTQVVGSGPQALIVIWGPDGACRLCIGNRLACRQICAPFPTYLYRQ